MEQSDIIFILIILVGGLIICWSVLRLQRNSQLERGGSTIEGVIIQVDCMGINNPAYYPIVRFQTFQREWITARSSFGTKFPQFKVGEIVKVRFDPTDPTNFIIKGEGSSMNAWLSALLGITIIVFAIIKYLNI